MKNVTKILDKLIAKEGYKIKTDKELKKKGLVYCKECKVCCSSSKIHNLIKHK